MATESQKRARNKYNAQNNINKTITLNKKTDQDIITYIEDKNFTGLVKDLIRKEIEYNKKSLEH